MEKNKDYLNLLLTRKYTKEQVIENIKAMGEGREQDINLPLRTLKIEEPEEYKKAYKRSRAREYQQRPEVKARKRELRQRQEVKSRKIIIQMKGGQRKLEINIDKIQVLRNIRTDLGDLSDLMTSIRENGLLEPIGISKINGEYILVFGHRRFFALKKLGRKSLEVGKEIKMINRTSSQDLLILNTVENFHRKDNTPLEFAKIVSDLREMGLTTAEIGVRLSVTKNKISVALNLLQAVPESQRKHLTYGGSGMNDRKGKLPANVANAIADRTKRYALNKKDTDKLYDIAREKELSTSNVKLVSLGLDDGIRFNNAIKLVDTFQNKQIELIVNKKEVAKIKIPFRKYVINCLSGKEKFNQKLLYSNGR